MSGHIYLPRHVYSVNSGTVAAATSTIFEPGSAEEFIDAPSFHPFRVSSRPGGIGTHAFELAKHLVNLGWEVSVITPQNYGCEEEIKAFHV